MREKITDDDLERTLDRHDIVVSDSFTLTMAEKLLREEFAGSRLEQFVGGFNAFNPNRGKPYFTNYLITHHKMWGGCIEYAELAAALKHLRQLNASLEDDPAISDTTPSIEKKVTPICGFVGRITDPYDDAPAIPVAVPGCEPQSREGKPYYDLFAFDRQRQPENMAYEWKRLSLLNQPDVSHVAAFIENGWTLVPADRHPEMAQFHEQGHIYAHGMVLMQIPMDTWRERQVRARQIAKDQVEANKRAFDLPARDIVYPRK